MAHVIIDTCTKDQLCVDSCPSGAIRPMKDEPALETVTQLYIDSQECMDCGACVPVCPTNSIFPVEELPEGKEDFAKKNDEYFGR